MTDALQGIADRYHLDAIYAFGSRSEEIKARLRGERIEQGPSPSDLDIGIKPARGSDLSVRDKVILTFELEDLFQVPRVDLVVLSEADPFVAANIIRGERLYCRNAYLADEYELYVLRRAGDLAHLERERLRIIFHEHE